ncbi:MAG: DinB family protein [Actinomycetia bacterium]|nr:DinB family protein [Actinomycetota bacterium]MCG2791599.1 DinB family protein [Actinomycetes bacterium]
MTDEFKQSVLEAFSYNLRYGLTLFRSTPEDLFFSFPNHKMNHAGWIAGHITLSHRRISIELGVDISLPNDWIHLFGMGTQPIADSRRYPQRDELIQAFIDGHSALELAFKNATPEKLNEPNTKYKPNCYSTIGAIAVHVMITHESVHLGQLCAWRKALGLSRIEGSA